MAYSQKILAKIEIVNMGGRLIQTFPNSHIQIQKMQDALLCTDDTKDIPCNNLFIS